MDWQWWETGGIAKRGVKLREGQAGIGGEPSSAKRRLSGVEGVLFKRQPEGCNFATNMAANSWSLTAGDAAPEDPVDASRDDVSGQGE